MSSHVPSNCRNETWTDEKHVHFLNSMETWFVRTMLENKDRYNILRLDRHVPDSSESTLDCKQKKDMQTRKKHAADSDFIGTTRSGRPYRSSRRRRSSSTQSQPYDYSSQDQVVPQIENRTGDNHE